MAAIEVGIRIDLEKGIAFFGVEEVNKRIREGGRVLSVRPAGAIMAKIGEDEANTTMTLSGCQIQIVFEEG